MPPLIELLDGPLAGDTRFQEMNHLGRGLRDMPYDSLVTAPDGTKHMYRFDYGSANYINTPRQEDSK